LGSRALPQSAIANVRMDATVEGVVKPTALPNRINNMIDLESPKVATMAKISEVEGEKGVFCRCWKSGTFPLCDAAHVEHNKLTGDNVGPLIVSKK